MVDRQGVDVLLTGVEVGLWMAEQLASDLALVFPKLRVQAISANKINQMLGSACALIGSTMVRQGGELLLYCWCSA